MMDLQVNHPYILVPTQVAQNALAAPSLVYKIHHGMALPQHSAQRRKEPLAFLTRFEIDGQVH